ncbi:hypothetical protein CEXT_76351 [Caerostris extrusa]|uniref:Uncharacterized protein n=1 Tax=Caerostris extrusa TaxID=172846 RepID=A0AAV4TSU6_CAEEX|nr:hypothetical protein CEXT_76351 [Caerostris extrusa]
MNDRKAEFIFTYKLPSPRLCIRQTPVSPAFRRRTMIADRSRNVLDALIKVLSHSRVPDKKPIFIPRNQHVAIAVGKFKSTGIRPDGRPQSRINLHLVCLQIALPAA